MLPGESDQVMETGLTGRGELPPERLLCPFFTPCDRGSLAALFREGWKIERGDSMWGQSAIREAAAGLLGAHRPVRHPLLSGAPSGPLISQCGGHRLPLSPDTGDTQES